MSSRVTIKSIAKDLGISHMTVSRALTNHPSVRDETRAQIVARAEELGYVRSTVASAMRGSATGIIGLLLPGIVNEFYARFADAFAQQCEARRQHLFIRLTNDEPAREVTALSQLRALQADSVVMVPTPGAASAEAASLLKQFDVVQLIRHRPDIASTGRVLLDDAGPLKAAVRHLAGVGHRRIGYIGATTQFSSGAGRLEAYLTGMTEAGLIVPEDLLHTDRPSFASGRAGLAAILDRPDPATAVITGGFEISNGALEEAMRRGLAMPRDIAFVGYGDPAFYRWIAGGVATVSLPVDDMARRAARMIAPGRGAADAEVSAMLPAELILRPSAGVAKT